jgi:hypothetical protein
MAQLYKTKGHKTYVALTDEEKDRIYEYGSKIHDEFITNPPGVPGWNKYDVDALTIPLLCKPFSEGGNYEDLQLTQIEKYNKMLVKTFQVNFAGLFDIDFDDTELTKQEIFRRMERRREQKRIYSALGKNTNTQQPANGYFQQIFGDD